MEKRSRSKHAPIEGRSLNHGGVIVLAESHGLLRVMWWQDTHLCVIELESQLLKTLGLPINKGGFLRGKKWFR